MAKTAQSGQQVAQFRGRDFSEAVRWNSHCYRCGGLMVGEFCLDLLNSTGELEFVAARCVQCGEVVDPLILRNRRLQQDAMAARVPQVSVRSVESQAAA